MTEATEQSILAPILEQIHLNFHNARQNVESEMSRLKLEMQRGDKSDADIAAAINRISQLQTEITNAKKQHLSLTSLLRIRAQYILDTETNTLSSQLHMHIASYLAERNYFDALVRLLKLNPELRDFIDLDLIADENRLANLVGSNKYDEPLEWCRKHRSSLKKVDPGLQFELQSRTFGQYVCLNTEEALEFGKHVFRKADPVHYPEISRQIRLLYAEPETLTSRDQLPDLTGRMRSAMRKVHHRSDRNILVNHALLGLASIKTKRCALKPPKNDSINPQLRSSACPACKDEYAELVLSTPAAQYAHSILDTDLYVFPHSDLLIGEQAIQSVLKTENEDEVLHPEGRGKVKRSDLTRAYAL